jgi:hypothetical protein
VTSTESLIETRPLQALIAEMKIEVCVSEMIGYRGHEVISVRILGALAHRARRFCTMIRAYPTS